MDERPARPPRRLAREEKTIAAMIALDRRDHHSGAASSAGERAGGSTGQDGDGLCLDCAELRAYARLRLEKCRYGADKADLRHLRDALLQARDA